jgi:TPP-dependent indolepyruvate ferredoxin oxidoreductase alpha subunit
MATKEQLAAVQKSLRERRTKLVKQGLCRDCGLNPIAPRKGKRKPTLCEDCREDRRTREANRRARLAGKAAD